MSEKKMSRGNNSYKRAVKDERALVKQHLAEGAYHSSRSAGSHGVMDVNAVWLPGENGDKGFAVFTQLKSKRGGRSWETVSEQSFVGRITIRTIIRK